jgi:integrase
VAREALLSVKREHWEREWRPALEAAAIPNFRFHDCRHTLASRLVMASLDLYTVQRAGGWKTQAMVQRYSHLSPDHIKAAVERLARGNSGAATGTKTGTNTQAG